MSPLVTLDVLVGLVVFVMAARAARRRMHARWCFAPTMRRLGLPYHAHEPTARSVATVGQVASKAINVTTFHDAQPLPRARARMLAAPNPAPAPAHEGD